MKAVVIHKQSDMANRNHRLTMRRSVAWRSNGTLGRLVGFSADGVDGGSFPTGSARSPSQFGWDPSPAPSLDMSTASRRESIVSVGRRGLPAAIVARTCHALEVILDTIGMRCNGGPHRDRRQAGRTWCAGPGHRVRPGRTIQVNVIDVVRVQLQVVDAYVVNHSHIARGAVGLRSEPEGGRQE